MTTHRLLYLSAHQMVAYRYLSGRLTSEATFPNTDNGYREFNDYLVRNGSSVFSMLVNVSEEGYQVDTIPFLRGGDRQAVIARKLDQLFFGAGLKAAFSLGTEKEQRKNEKILFASLTNDGLLSPWLDIFAAQDAALAGVYSLPQLVPPLLRKLSLNSEACLVLTVQDHSIRQSYIAKGELHFSRLAQIHHSSIGDLARNLATEAPKLQQYLASQRLITRHQPLTAYIVAHRNALKAIEEACTASSTIRYSFVDIEECAKRTGLKTTPASSHSEELFLNLLATRPPRVQFAGDEPRHGFYVRLIRKTFQGIGAVALLACLLVAGKMAFDTYSIAQETTALRADAALAQQRYAQIVRSFPPTPGNDAGLRTAIERYGEMERKSRSPDDLFHEISRALQVTPAADIESIEWKVVAADKSAAQPRTSPEAMGGETAVVRGVIRYGDRANARQVLATFDMFVQALRNNPELQIEIIQRPFDIESAKVLKGGDTRIEDDAPRPFSVSITRKLPA